ncbi:hypothetical protein O181_113309 [Austropuccinia psidii MF-1]|uniref:Uncharacterized protein n=1 Tax=Austropuccinia psidii MF-1 TaxID=1389203 RepID=A0A9Q3K5M2_9BASI|nr:hypothetical protein [Austropuccinia psidii MF-1]
MLISTFNSSELTLPPFVETFQPNEPPIPGPSKPPEPHEDALICEPEREVALVQSMEEPFDPPSTPAMQIPTSSPPAPSSPNCHNEAHQEFMDLGLTLIIP